MDRLINIAFTVILGVLMILMCVQMCMFAHYGVAIGCAMIASIFGVIVYKESKSV
jgi:hypothetical protein